LENLPVEGLVRLWAHEALRLFQDRLVEDSERRWTNENIDIVALKHFPGVDRTAALSRPILYSNWLSKDYVPVDREELRDYVKARLKVSVRAWILTFLCSARDFTVLQVQLPELQFALRIYSSLS
jgi:dynein heavy chain 1